MQLNVTARQARGHHIILLVSDSLVESRFYTSLAYTLTLYYYEKNLTIAYALLLKSLDS